MYLVTIWDISPVITHNCQHVVTIVVNQTMKTVVVVVRVAIPGVATVTVTTDIFATSMIYCEMSSLRMRLVMELLRQQKELDGSSLRRPVPLQRRGKG